jgi:hypothetical protein
MLRTLRNQTQSIFFKAFLFLLIVGFALWGVGDLTGGLNKKPILSFILACVQQLNKLVIIKNIT